MNGNKNKELFETMPVPQAVRTMVVPTILGQMIILIYNMADTFFIGRAENPYMVAAASLVLPVFNICLSVAGLAGVGGGALVSRLLGQHEEDEARRAASFSLYLAAGCGLLLSLALAVFMRPLLTAIGAGENTYDYARTYALCVIVFGGVPTILTNVLANMVRSIGESSKAGFGVTMGGVINIFLDPLFMFVLLPEGNEVLGAGIATCISNVISCVYFILTVRKLGNGSVITLMPLRERPSRNSIRQIFSVGVPSSIVTLLFDLDFMIIGRLMASYSDIAVAASGIVLKVERLPLNIGVGICQGMVPVVAYNYAAKNYRRMNEISGFALRLGILCGVVSIILYELFAPQVMQFFINEAETVALGTKFLRARAPATIFMFLSFFHVHLFNSYGRGDKALMLGINRWLVLNIPMLFLLNWLFGMYGIVWGQLCADFINVITSLVVHRRFLKKENMV